MNIRRFDLIFATALCATSCLTVAHASTCDATSVGATATLTSQARGPVIPLKDTKWTNLSDCSHLHVESGTAQIRGLVGGIPKKLKCDANSDCALPSGSKSLWVSLTASYTEMAGGHRADENVIRKAGIPFSDIYDPKAAARFDFSSLQEPVKRFVLLEDGTKTPVYQTAVTDSKVTIPENVLARGKKYTWQGFGTSGKPSGSFALMDNSDATIIASELAAQAGGSDRPQAQKLYDELEVYNAHELYYEMAQVREALGKLQ